MRIKNLFPQLFSFGDCTIALWAVHPYALARTALRQEPACGGGLPAISGKVLDVGCESCPIAACLLVIVHITV